MARSWRIKSLAAIGAAVGLTLVGVAARSFQQAGQGGDAAGAGGGWEEPVAIAPGLVMLDIEVGLGDETPANWTGEVLVSEGRVRGVEVIQGGGPNAAADGQRFMVRTKAAAAKKKKKAAQAAPAVVRALVDAPEDATVTVHTDQGAVEVALADLASGPKEGLDGQVRVTLRPASIRLTGRATEDDYPAMATAPDGTTWMAYVEYHPERFRLADQPSAEQFDAMLVPTKNGDRVRLARFADGAWMPPVDVTDGLRDVWRPTVAVDGDGNVVVAWAEQREENWDIYHRTYRPAADAWGEEARATDDPGTDFHVVAATADDGTAWLAWMGFRDDDFDILAAPLGERPRIVSDSVANDWTPSIAAGPSGVWVAWDSYDAGNYDVMLRNVSDEDAGVVAVADSARFEARPHLAVDGKGRAWVAFEVGDEQWGKDFSTNQYERIPFEENPGFALYINRTVAVRCVEDGRVRAPGADLQQSFGTLSDRNKSLPRLALDGSGGLWLWFRHHPLPGGAGEAWVSSAMRLGGDSWSGPRLIPNSSNLLDNRPALAPSGEGLLAVFSSDTRTNTAGRDQDDLFTALIAPAEATGDVTLADPPPDAEPTLESVHPNEEEDIARMRSYRVEAGGTQLRLLRGEFHRHTELSAHRDGDGTLEDSWRYALDAADHDWMGNGDHMNGANFEYMWWYVQKMTDLMTNAPRFVGTHTYERSAVFPNGHRNVMFPRRGIRPLPFGELQGTPEGGTPDTKVLYQYLKHFGGFCAVHTSATNMGTDWRDNDPEVEPVVEIYQGHRHNYEHLGAPRAPTAETQIGGYQPEGFVWNALEKGYKLGFQSSSDHVSTHWSYAVVLTDDVSRQGVVDAFKKRHSYAATDNIILDVRSGDHLMGDEFTTADRPSIRVAAHGTSPIARVHVIRDNRYALTTEPGKPEVSFLFTDEEIGLAAGVHYYYVRVEQEDGNLAWSSPIWITYQPAQDAE